MLNGRAILLGILCVLFVAAAFGQEPSDIQAGQGEATPTNPTQVSQSEANPVQTSQDNESETAPTSTLPPRLPNEKEDRSVLLGNFCGFSLL